jgi:polysaccharide pyruvyl transferase CsaB
MPKSVLIAGYYGFGNLGDEAILTAIVRRLRAHEPHLWITVVSGGFAPVAEGLEEVYVHDLPAVVRAAEAADLLILGGGGLFFDYTPAGADGMLRRGYTGLALYGSLPLLATALGKPIFFWNVGVGPLAAPPAQELTRLCFLQADGFTVRDEPSAALLRGIGVDVAGEQILADASFDLEPAPAHRARAILEQAGFPLDRPMVAICLREWAQAGSMAPPWGEIAAALDAFAEEAGVSYLMLPFQQLDSPLVGDHRALEAVRERMRLRQFAHLLALELKPAEAAALLGQCELVVGMRMHSLVLAGIAGVPTVPLAYDPKVEAAAEQLGLERFLLSVGEVSAQGLLEKLRAAWASRAALAQEVRARAARLQARAGLAVSAALRLLAEGKRRPAGQEVEAFVHRLLITRSLQLFELEGEASSLARTAEALKEGLAQRDEHIAELTRRLAEGAELIASLSAQNEEKALRLQELEAERQRLARELHGLQGERDSLKEVVASLQARLSWKRYRLADAAVLPLWHLSVGASSCIGAAKRLARRAAATALPAWLKRQLRRRLQERAAREEATEWVGQLAHIVRSSRDARGIIVYPPTVDWGFMFQRPQQLARALARAGYLYFYCTDNTRVDKVQGFQQVAENLYVCHVPWQTFCSLKRPVVLVSWAAHWPLVQAMKDAIVVYDCLDDLEVGGGYVSEHENLLQRADIVLATSAALVEHIRPKRPDVVFCPNAADYDFFAGARREGLLPSDLEPIVQAGKPIAGYHGALAKWFDYRLLAAVAELMPHFNFVLLGVDYDGTLGRSGVLDLPNVRWLGLKPYEQLPDYLRWFNVGVIPFQVNNITVATSPIKLWEYLAAGKPVVASDLPMCRGLDGVWVARSAGEFAQAIDLALAAANEDGFLAKIDAVARANTWEARGQQIIAALEGLRRRGQ